MAATKFGKILSKLNASALAVTTALLSATPLPASPLLRGYVKEDTACNRPLPANISVTTPLNACQEQQDPLARFAGTWQSITTVTDSLISTVEAGQRVVSTMEFARSNEGHLYAKWQQPGWREAHSAVTITAANNFVIDRTSYYLGDRTAGSWATRSRDQYSLVDGNKILASSEVDQYLDGRYLGRYTTQSVLLKVSDATSVALQR